MLHPCMSASCIFLGCVSSSCISRKVPFPSPQPQRMSMHRLQSSAACRGLQELAYRPWRASVPLSTSVLGVMSLYKFCRRFVSRLGRIFSGTKADCRSHFQESSNLGDIDDRIGKPNGLHTVRNALTVVLRTLSSVSKNIPFGLILSSVIDPLLDITDRIEQVPSNAEALIALSARIDLLTPIVSEMTEDKAERGRALVEALQRELESITEDLKDARAQGKLEQFLNSTDNAPSLTQHNMALAQMIADSTLVTVHEVLIRVHNLERSKFSESSVPPRQVEMEDIRGGFGVTGSGGLIGGEGGEGEGPDLEMSLDEHWKVGAISGGTGGKGGEGIAVGGKGGTGRGPIIRALRNPVKQL
ncbi:hypothetical protein FB451DRAFT_1533072 [Mycena latifolia]|nr:hypothetical protein FB451DRAFT_1533072 [Mycena latifolia]